MPLILVLAINRIGAADAPTSGEQPSPASAADGVPATARGLPDAQALAADALADARRQSAQGHHVRARELYLRALRLRPDDAVARDELGHLEDILAGRAGSPGGDADPGRLRTQAACAEARTAEHRADLLARGGRFEEAGEVLALARTSMLPCAGDPEVAAGLARLDGVIDELRRSARTAQSQRASAERRGDLATAETAAALNLRALTDSFHARLERVLSLEARREYELALALCRTLLRDHPDQGEVEQAFNRLISEVHDQRRLSAQEREQEIRQEVLERMERDLIPTGFDGEPIYPADWRERHLEPTVYLGPPPEQQEWAERLRERLAQRVSIDFAEQNAAEVLEVLRRAAGVDLIVDPTASAVDGALVTIRAKDMAIEDVLNWVCRLIGQPWRIAHGAIYVGGKEDAAAVLGLYDISNLVFQARDQQGMAVGYQPVNAAGGAGRAGGGGALDIFKPSIGVQGTAIAPEDVKDMISKAVSPATWADSRYGIEVRGHDLFVSAPPATHLLIQQFIKSQLNMRSLLVRVEVRWIELDDSFLEEIGVDWKGSNELLALPAQRPGGFNRTTDQFDHDGTLQNILPATAAAPAPPTLGTGLSLASTFLRAAQVSSILRAVERNERGTILQAPVLTTMNGIQATCFFGKQIAYLGGYTAGTGAANPGVTAGIAPQINVVNVGGNLTVKPFVSSDGKYVTLDLTPSIASVDFFRENVTTTRTFATGAPDPGTGAQQTQNVRSNNPLDIPNLLTTAVATTVRIPDRGTLLIGGFGNHLEQTASTKVPFLGHIPFLGRLFGARGRYSVRYQIYLLTTVTVINFDELEAAQ